MTKPKIIVLSQDDDREFKWLSVGWYEAKKQKTSKAQSLMAKARRCIDAARDVPDAIKRLRKAGFTVTRDEVIVEYRLMEVPS